MNAETTQTQTPNNLMDQSRADKKLVSNRYTDEQLLSMGQMLMEAGGAARNETPETALCNLLCAGLESGPYGSVRIHEFIEPKEMKFRTDVERVFRHLDYPMNEGGALIVVDKYEEDDGETNLFRYRLDRAALLRGLARLAMDHPAHFGDWLKGSEDAITGDCLVQCAVFGNTIYG